MIRAYLLLGVTTLLGNGVTLAPIMAQYHRLTAPVVAPLPNLLRDNVARSADGLFRLTASVDQQPVTFVVDTGATVTVLSRLDAERLGLTKGRDDPSGLLITANGSARMTWKRVAGLAVAGIRVRDLEVAVGGDEVSHSLLGQDVLSQIGAITISGDRLEVRPARS